MTKEKIKLIENLSNLLKDYENETSEQIELRFAFFNDDLNKYFFWEDGSFEYREDMEELMKERNNSEIVHIDPSLGDWVKLKPNEIGVKDISFF